MFIWKYKLYIFYFLASFISCLPVLSNAASLHVIIVADVADNSIGYGDAVDRDNITAFVKDIAEATELDFSGPKFINLEGDSITSSGNSGQGYEQVTRAVKNLAVASDDVVVFFYSGHGLASERSTDWPWPRLSVEGQYGAELLEMSWVQEELWKKKPRLLLVFADACNSEVESNLIIPVSKGLPSSGYKKLFMEYEGFLLASSSSRGEASIATSGGGLFTNALLKELNKEINLGNEATWEALISRLEGASVSDDDSQHPQLDGSALTKMGSVSKNNDEDTANSCPHPAGTCKDMGYWQDTVNDQCYCCDSRNKKRPSARCD